MKVNRHIVFLVLLLLVSIVLLSTPLVIERFFINNTITTSTPTGTLYIWNNWKSKSSGFGSFLDFNDKSLTEKYSFLKKYFNSVVICDAWAGVGTDGEAYALKIAKNIIPSITTYKYYKSCGDSTCKVGGLKGIMIDFEASGQTENITAQINDIKKLDEVIITSGKWKTLFKTFDKSLFTRVPTPPPGLCPPNSSSTLSSTPNSNVKILVQTYSSNDLICLKNPENWWTIFINNSNGELTNKNCWTKPFNKKANPISSQIIPAISCGKTAMDNKCWDPSSAQMAQKFATALENLLEARQNPIPNNIVDLCLYLG